MQITLSKYAGFCDGVDRAYKMVKKIAADPKVKKPIYVLGLLVHNRDVVESVEKLGVKKIRVGKDLFRILDSMQNKIGTLVVTAHGMGPKIYAYAAKKGIDMVDTTCPKVVRAQRLAKIFKDKNYQIVIIGEKEHKEVKGVCEWADNKAFFVQKKADLKRLKLDPRKKIAVISQTTQNQEFVKRAWEFMHSNYPQVEVVDTICLATHNRQDEARQKASQNDVVIVIGSPESANSNQLWEIASGINSKSYFIESAKQLKKTWFKGAKKVWVTAGASTPDWIISGVIGILKKM
ncbi:MAG: 4-hydroxy-3-methylbut-2-enyl diphosphate reductase [Parcubacteria group bacterium]|jgi:4-hydroxy-3-methylbut-2-enyl diphosphate reductase